MNTRKSLAVMLVGSLFLLAGCEKEDAVRVYKTPKEPGQLNLPAGHPDLSKSQPEQPQQSGEQEFPVDFKVPEGWKLKGSGGMAAVVLQAGDPPINVTVTQLGAASGGLLMNVNRWEQQIGLQPTPEANLSKVAKPVKIDGKDGHMVDLAGPQQGMLAAVVTTAEATWYFKLMGPAEQVAGQRKAFNEFLQSVKFQPSKKMVSGGAAAPSGGNPHAGMDMGNPHGGTGPADPRAGDPHAGMPMTKPAAGGDANKLEGIASYKLPEGWQLDPTPRMMRVGTIFVGSGDQKAELAISRLGSFGEPLANINRWRGQVGAAPVNDPASVKPQIVNLDKGPVAIYDFEGPADAGAGRKRMVVAQTQFKDATETWFFRLAGPYETVGKAKPAFEAFVKSLKFE